MESAKSSWMGKIAGVAFVALGLSGFLLLAVDYMQELNSGPTDKLQVLWAEDVKLLQDHNKLPEAWNSIKEIELIPATETAKEWAKKLEIPIAVNEAGSHRLEVLLLSWSQDETNGAIVQYNLVDLKSNNMVWELGRTYYITGEPPK